MTIATHLAYIEQMGDEREGENVAFRSFLKNLSISDEELDAVVHQINDEVTAQIDCTSCANCCKVFSPILNDEDISTFASGLELSVADLEGQFLKLSENEPSGHEFREQPCPFLVVNRCSNYEYRPGDCRSYPYLHKENFRGRLLGVIGNYAICPIVFNVYERLKVELWRDRGVRHRTYRI